MADGDWLSTEDSVFERPSIRFASFVGVVARDEGDMESNTPERSWTSLDGGVPYVRDTLGPAFTGVEDSSTLNSTSVSASASTFLLGDGVRIRESSETFRRFEVCPVSEVPFRLALGLFPYVCKAGITDEWTLCDMYA